MQRFAYFSTTVFPGDWPQNKKARLTTGLAVLWCPDPESNQGHADFQSAALPTELSGQNCVTQNGAAYPSRTDDLLITSQLLYQLS
jgi:hypothetical protein